jgi:hypothetical protein
MLVQLKKKNGIENNIRTLKKGRINMNLAEKILNDINEASREGTEKFRGMTFEIWHQVPKGYFAKGKGEVKKEIAKQYFDKYDDAKEHAEMEIGGYLDMDESNEEEKEIKRKLNTKVRGQVECYGTRAARIMVQEANKILANVLDPKHESPNPKAQADMVQIKEAMHIGNEMVKRIKGVKETKKKMKESVDEKFEPETQIGKHSVKLIGKDRENYGIFGGNDVVGMEFNGKKMMALKQGNFNFWAFEKRDKLSRSEEKELDDFINKNHDKLGKL